MSLSTSSFADLTDPFAVTAGDHCPWCNQPIPHEKFDEIHARIQAKELERTTELERRLKEQFTREKAQAEAKAKADVEQARKDAAAAVETVKHEAAEKEAAAREEAKKAAEGAMASKVAEAQQARKAAEDQLQAVRGNHQNELNHRLQEQRDALEKAHAAAVNTEKANAFKDRQKFDEKLQELQRQLQKKTAEELGEGAEVDLFEALKAEFQEDQITRIAKGGPGADILHKAIHNGRVCGSIIYDSKNRNAWRNEYVTKLREDQLAARSEHAILATAVFPAGAKQLHIQDSVIITNPARAIALVQLLRRHIVQTHALRLSNEARDQKTLQLYEFITSDRCAQLLGRIESLTDAILDLEVKEQAAHESTWKKRGGLVRSVQKAHGDFSFEIERIVGTAASAA